MAGTLRMTCVIGCVLAGIAARGAERWYGSIEGWGLLIDPDGDCAFTVSDDQVLINVPETPHGFSAELNRMNAPRVLQQVSGDFDFEVEVGGTFQPQEPTVPTRTPYLGAGIVLMRDDANYVRLERAALKRAGNVRHYINFEQRRHARLLRFGTPGDYSLEAGDHVRLKVSVRGKSVTGLVQKNGANWHELGTKEFVAGGRFAVGVAAINATNVPQKAEFRELRLTRLSASKPDPTPEFADGLRAVFVHGDDVLAGRQYKQLLASHRINVQLMQASQLRSNPIANADLIIIGSDAFEIEFANLARSIRKSRKPVLGIGRGGHEFFGALSLDIGSPNGWRGKHSSVRPVMDLPFWTGYVTKPNQGAYQLYTETGHVGIHITHPHQGVIGLAKEPASDVHYPIAQQQPFYVLWGFDASPAKMTEAAESLFPWTCYYTAALGRSSEQDTVPPADVSVRSPAVQRMSTALELQSKIERVSELTDAELEALTDRVVAFLRTRPDEITTSLESRLAFQLGRALEKAGESKRTAGVYRRMAEAVESGADGRADRLSRALQGASRLAALPGERFLLSGKTLSGKPFRWNSYDSKVVLVHFWASWGDAGQQDLLALKKLYQRFQDSGFDVVGVSLDEDRNKPQQVLQKLDLPWATLFEEGSGWSHPMAEKYGISKAPTSVMVDRDGNVVAVNPDLKELPQRIEKLLGRSPAAEVTVEPEADQQALSNSAEEREPGEVVDEPR